MTPGNSLYFPAVDFMRARVGRAGVKEGSSQLPVVVDCRYILGADFTAAKVSANAGNRQVSWLKSHTNLWMTNNGNITTLLVLYEEGRMKA